MQTLIDIFKLDRWEGIFSLISFGVVIIALLVKAIEYYLIDRIKSTNEDSEWEYSLITLFPKTGNDKKINSKKDISNDSDWSYSYIKNISFEVVSLFITKLGFSLDRLKEITTQTAVIFFSLQLINRLMELIEKRRQSETSEQALLNITVIGLLVGQKARQISSAYVALILALILYPLTSLLLIFEIKSIVIAFIALLFILLFINQKSLEYRIKKGLYGSNEYEAREILSFIINHSDKSNFTDGSGLREIMPAAEPDNVYGIEVIEGVRGAEA